MAPVNNYKSMENRVAEKIGTGSRKLLRTIGDFFRAVVRKGKQKFTIMLIPHSEKSIFNFQISVFAIVFSVTLLVVILIVGMLAITGYTGQAQFSSKVSKELQNAGANMDQMREEISDLARIAGRVKESLNPTMKAFDIGKQAEENPNMGNGGDLFSFDRIEEVKEEGLPELDELRSVKAWLERIIKPVREISDVKESLDDLLVNIPTVWPVQGGGFVTQNFGPAEHPFTGQWYIHKGVDIAFAPGTPIVATANGTVMKVDFDRAGFGNYIMIKHKFGIYTRYAHLLTIRVQKGDEVRRGQVIGTLGSTGLSTGPHLHYEVSIGTDVVNPMKYLNIRSAKYDD